MKKKILSLILAIAMVLPLVPAFELPVAAASSGTTGDCTWTLDGTTLTISGNGAMEDYTSSNKAPWGTSIKKVIIEDGVTSIGNWAFRGCSFSSIEIPSSVTSIGERAFISCNCLTSITIPDSVITIEDYAFANCTTVLTSIEIPKSVTNIGAGILSGCRALETITVASENPAYYCHNNCLIEISTKTLVATCKNSSIPGNNSINIIGASAFAGRESLTSVTIPNSVTTIGNSAFSGCVNLASIKIPNSVTTIEQYAFQSCAITSITIPSSVTSINLGTFQNCSYLSSITLPISIISIGEKAFPNCDRLTKVWYEGTETDKKNIAIGDNNESLSSATWNYNSCVNSSNTNKMHSYDDSTDTTCNICGAAREPAYDAQGTTGDCTWYLIGTELTITGNGKMDDYKVLDEYQTYASPAATPWGTAITKVVIEEGVTNVGEFAFANCKDLQSIYISKTVINIPLQYSVAPWIGFPFWGCSSLASIVVEEGNSVYSDNDSNCIIKNSTIILGCKNSVIPTDGSITIINDYAFVSSPDSIFIPISVKYINDDALKSPVIWYQGSVEAKAGINFGVFGRGDTGAVWYYNSCPKNPSDQKYHVYDNDCDNNCNECGYVRTITHNYSVQDQNTASHFMKCQICGTIDETSHENHGYDNACDTTCNKCGYIRSITHNYSVLNKNSETHWIECSVCGTIDETTRKVHNYDDNCDTTCNNCGYVRSVSHNYSVQDKNAETHWMKCALCGTIDESSRKKHIYDNACDTDCNECGHTRTISHNYSVQDKNTNSHWMKCSVCGEINESTREAHNYTVLNKNEALHWLICSVCGSSDTTSFSKHIYDNACDSDCNVCDVERQVPNHVYSNTCDAFCNECQAERQVPDHVYSNACDSTCNECGAERQVQDHTYDNTYDTTCNICNQPREVVKNIKIDDVSIIEGTSGYFYGTTYYYSIYYPTWTVTFHDGTVAKIERSSGVELDDQWYSLSIDTSSQYSAPWQAGNTYAVTGTFLGTSTTFNVSILKTPAKTLEISDVVLYQGLDSHNYGSTDHYYVNPSFVVTMEDGTVIKSDYGFDYGGEYYYLSDNSSSLQSASPWTPGNTYQVTGNILGISATFNVTIKENPIVAVQIVKQPNKTEYLVGEHLDLNGATIRVYYNDNTYEDFTFDAVTTSMVNMWDGCFSEKFQKYLKCSISVLQLTTVGFQAVQIDFGEKSCNLIVTVRENLINSITIKEEADKSITITVRNSDNSSYDMKLLDIYTAMGDDDFCGGVLITDKGVFEGGIYFGKNGFSVCIFLSEEGEPIRSNTLSYSEWFDVWWLLDQTISDSLICFLTQFNGTLTSENIDSVFDAAFMMEYMHSNPADYDEVEFKNNRYVMTGEHAKSLISKYFEIEQIDLSLSSRYNSEDNTYNRPSSGWGSGPKYLPYDLTYSNGIWSAKIKYASEENYAAGGTETIYLKLNSNRKIIRVSSSEITHEYTVQDKDSTNHWMKCSLCGTIDKASREAHVYDNACDTICDECGYVRQVPDHVYDNACDTTCNICDENRSITHDYRAQAKDTETHWLKCSICGTTDESTREEHKYDNIVDPECNECGYLRTLPYDSYGVTGDCYWYLEGTKLTIFGNGAMGNYTSTGPWGTSVTEVVFEEGVTTIGEYAFYGCSSLNSVIMSNSVTTIKKYAFAFCSTLSTITFGNSANAIETNAFENCSEIYEVCIPSLNVWCKIKWANATANPFCHSPQAALSVNGEYLTHIVVPADIKTIYSYAFFNCATITSVKISEGVETVSSYAFDGCNHLEKIELPSTIVSIQSNAFRCYALKQVHIPTLLDWLEIDFESSLFSQELDVKLYAEGKEVRELIIPHGATEIPAYAFFGFNFSTIVIPEGVTQIGNVAFNQSFKVLFLPKSISKIGYWGLPSGSTQREVWYYGDPGDKEKIDDQSYFLYSAAWHYVDSDCVDTCKFCSAKRDTLVPHSYDGICDTDCNICKQHRTAPHDYSVQDKDEANHWIKCSVCGTPDETTRKAHGYDNACDTTCAECGYVRDIIHDYSVLEHSENEHWFKCSICGTIDESTRETHDYDNACDTTCDECGYVRQVPDHIYDNACDTNCNECSKSREVTHDYSVQDKNTDTHWMKCSVCDKIDETAREAHKHDSVCDTECNICGQTRTVPHVYDNAEDLICNECGHERPPYIPGDVDGIGTLDMDDAIYLLYYVNFPDFYPINLPADFDGSGVVDMDDAIYLLYHVNFPDFYPLH